jgi:hypothetical protein
MLAYKLHYSDYPGTDTGPPDPDRWVGPPGPPGPVAGNPFPEAPNNGPIYGRGGATVAWTPVLPIAGGTLTGRLTAPTLTLSGLPTSPAGLPSGAVWSNGGVLCVAP